jgi:predicted phosphodiesterase
MYGHSHKSKIYKEDGILYINPGSVGPRRFKLPTTMMKLTILDNESKDIQETKENTFIYKCYRVEQITID